MRSEAERARGTGWRIWDLHAHTPASIVNGYGGNSEEAWARFIDDLEARPGRADRGEHRSQLDLRRIAVELVVAQRVTPLWLFGWRLGVHQARVVYCANRVGDVGAGTVGRGAVAGNLARWR
jgi:hypothetical protein